MIIRYYKPIRLALFVSLAGLSVNANSETHLVQKDDTLWGISNTYLGSGFHWKRIWQENVFIENPDLILPGQVLLIPSTTSPSVAKEISTSSENRVPINDANKALVTRKIKPAKNAVTRPLDYRNDSRAKKVVIERNGVFVIVDADSLKPKPADAQKLGKGIYIDQSLFK